jgi:hypothetical protein
MVQALNYPAAAARGLERFIEDGKQELNRLIAWDQPVHPDMAHDILSCERFLGLLRFPLCEHFQLPEGGHLFNDELKAIRGKPVKLPYPLISISYRVDTQSPRDSNTFDGSKLVHVPKRVAVAIELAREQLPVNARDVFPGCQRVCMVMAIFATEGDNWRPCMSVVLLPTDKWDGTGFEGETVETPSFMTDNKCDSSFVGKISVMLPWHYRQAVKMHGEDYALRSIHHDIAGEVEAVLELCEALSCSNVYEASIQEPRLQVNARRIREGKLPLWRTKVLKVRVPRGREQKPWQGGHHDTPGYHICMGYTRRVPWSNGAETQWIQDYGRGDPAKGVIKKTYRVTT